jgi:hypothetical protein
MRTEGRTSMTKPVVALRNFANASKKRRWLQTLRKARCHTKLPHASSLRGVHQAADKFTLNLYINILKGYYVFGTDWCNAV